MIIVVQTKLPPYRIPFFLALSKRIPLKVLYAEFENMSEEDLPERNNIFVPVSKSTLNFFGKKFAWLSISSLLKSEKAEAVVLELSNYNLNLLYFSIIKPFLNFKLLGWGHGYFRKDKIGIRKIPRYIKKFTGTMCDSVIVYTKGGKDYLKQIGVNSRKIHIAWNAVGFPSSKNQLSAERKFYSRRCVFLGRLIPEKNPGFTCQVIERLNSGKERFYLDVIGDGPLLEPLKEKYANQDFITFHGSVIDDKKLGNILTDCSILINPGYLGLNIVHALAYMLPIVSVKDGVNGIYHSPEFEYIRKEQCYISIDCLDVDSFTEAIDLLFSDMHRYIKVALSTEKVLSKLSIERMVKGYLEAFKN